MSKTVRVKDTIIGEGIPKICVPMTGRTLDQLLEEAELLKDLSFDVVEWRADFFEAVENIESVSEALRQIRTLLPNKPLIFTFRNAVEGGKKKIEPAYYTELNKAMTATRLVDLIDVELFSDAALIQDLVQTAHDAGVAVIISNHDFNKTPPKKEIMARLLKGAELGGDICKIAVMPKNKTDVMELMDATRMVKEDHGVGPLIAISMGGLGLISRLSCEIFGSDLTFGAAKKISAPGQVAVDELKRIIELIHRNMD